MSEGPFLQDQCCVQLLNQSKNKLTNKTEKSPNEAVRKRPQKVENLDGVKCSMNGLALDVLLYL